MVYGSLLVGVGMGTMFGPVVPALDPYTPVAGSFTRDAGAVAPDDSHPEGIGAPGTWYPVCPVVGLIMLMLVMLENVSACVGWSA